MRHTWSFYSAGHLRFGPGAVSELGDHVSRLSVGRVLVITDSVLAANGVLDRVLAPLRACGIVAETFTGGQPEPALELADECAAFARPIAPQAVLGLGGGSNMDLAKIVATLLTHGKAAIDYVGEDKIPGPVLPIVCVPTTSGTGSEVTAASVLTNRQTALKVGVLSNLLRPKLAVVDPQLTYTCPAKVTADSGIDALAHAIEAFTAIDNEDFDLPAGERSVYQGRNPLACCLAETAIRMIARSLAIAVEDGRNIVAREEMSLGATLAGLAFSNIGVALVHAMEYPVGAATHCSHGAGNGLLLPYVMRFNRPVRETQFARIAELMGEPVAGVPVDEASHLAITAIERLARRIKIPARLSELGVTADQLPGFADRAAGIKRILRVNPRPVTAADALAIYQEAL